MRAATVLILLTCISPQLLAIPCRSAEQLMASIWKELSAGNVSGAEQILHEIERTHAECPEVILARARVAAAKGAPVEAEDLFARYADLVPNQATAYSFHARFLLERGQYPRADVLSVQALKKDPNDVVALAVHGEILDMKGQTLEGMGLLEKACRLDPLNAEGQFRLAMIYDRAKRLADAVQHFEKAVETDPEDARAWDYLALNVELVGDLDGAELAYQKGLQVNQAGRYHDAFLDYNYGRFLAKRNDLSGSKRHLDRAVESAPQVRAVWYERAKLDMRMQNYQQARADAEKAHACTQQGGVIDLQIYSLLSQVYARLGDTALAKKYTDLTRETPPPVRGEQR